MAEREHLFEEIAAEADVEASQAVAGGDAANVSSSASFTPGCNDHEAGPSTSIVDLTSTDNVLDQVVDSDEE